MKYVVVLYDGMADYPVPALGGKTPMMVANKPNFDRLAQRGEVGLVRTVAEGLKPGSDVANLSVMGYDPKKYYTGRSPLEAVSIGVKMADDDIALRCNVVTLSDEPNYEDKTMIDYSAGDISSAEAAEIIKTVQEHFGGGEFDFIFNPKLFDGVNDHEDNRKNKKAPGEPRLVPVDVWSVYASRSSTPSVSTISSASSFIDRLILLSLVFNTFALTFSPTLSTSDGFPILRSQICEMCTSPLSPLPRSINAPYGIRLSTVPSSTVPGTIIEIL